MNVYNPAQKSVAKQVITIWADNRGRLVEGNFNFSFGDSSQTSKTGYPMLCPGRILKYGITAAHPNAGGDLHIGIVINDQQKGEIECSFSPSIESQVVTPSNSIELNQGDVISFKTLKTTASVRSCIIALLIEIDL